MTITQKLKWGILDAARVNERLLPAITEAPNSQLVAIASRRAGEAQETLKKYAPNSTRDLFKAMKQVTETGQGSIEQIASIGCNIKWRGSL
jgi:hypothetical protein